MGRVLRYFKAYLHRRHVRPWALLAPVIVLLVSLPMLRPLRHPDPRAISDEELSRLATVQAMVERHTVAIDQSNFAFTRGRISNNGHWYSDQPPTMAALLYGPYWTMSRLGLSFRESPDWVMYLLTVIGVTLPVAGAAGLVYRMGRLFELHRPWRAGLALAAVFGTGLISYATVLNGHAPAAVLVLAAAACLVHLTISSKSKHAIWWVALAGFCAALAAAIDLPAVVFLVLFVPVILAIRWKPGKRVRGTLLYLLGAAGPIALHAMLTVPVTGDLLPGSLHPELRRGVDSGFDVIAPADGASPDAYELDEPQPAWRAVTGGVARFFGAFLGGHGMLSHFPVLVVGVAGVSLVMHRHWPGSAKMLAGATVAGGLVIILAFAVRHTDWRDAMFATRWFVVFLPMTLFWAGAWLRRRHRPAAWVVVGVFLAFSVFVSLLGATGPLPRDGFGSYTVAGAVQNLVHPPQPDPDAAVLAGRFSRMSRVGE